MHSGAPHVSRALASLLQKPIDYRYLEEEHMKRKMCATGDGRPFFLEPPPVTRSLLNPPLVVLSLLFFSITIQKTSPNALPRLSASSLWFKRRSKTRALSQPLLANALPQPATANRSDSIDERNQKLCQRTPTSGLQTKASPPLCNAADLSRSYDFLSSLTPRKLGKRRT